VSAQAKRPARQRAVCAQPSLIWRPGGTVAYQPGNSVSALAEVHAPAAIGSLPVPHFLCLAPAQPSLPPLPLFDEASLPAEVVAEHRERDPPPPVHVYALPDHELGGGGLLHRNGRLFRNPDVLPAYFDMVLQPPGQQLPEIWGGALFDTPAAVCTVNFPLAVAVHPNVVYGHFLLEILPRLHLLSRLRAAGVAFKLALHISMPGWAKAIAALYFAPPDIFWYDSATTRLRCRYFIVPGMMHTRHLFHPEFNAVVEELKAIQKPPAAPAPRKLFLSRAGSRGRHGIANESAVEATVAARGYHIVQPEKLSFPEQIGLMQGADIIASAYSSAIHNSLFARPGTKVFCINRLNHYQSGIGALRAQPIGYFAPDAGQFRTAPQGDAQAWYTVDCAALAATMRRFEDWRPS
jgi:hypothetical protein